MVDIITAIDDEVALINKSIAKLVVCSSALLAHRNEDASVDDTPQINAAIAGLVVRRSAHRVRRNEHAPVNCLPNELLVDIFRSAHLLEATKQFEPYPRTLVTAARVCSRWRALLHNSPSLWSDIDLGYRDGAIFRMLELSQQSILALHAEFRDEEEVEKVADMLSHIVHNGRHSSRVRLLRLDLFKVYGGDELIEAILPWSFANLENLELYFPSGSSLSFPDSDSCSQPPINHLRTLTMHGGRPISLFDALSLKTLTSLELGDAYVSNVSQFLGLISNQCPELRHLSLIQITDPAMRTTDHYSPGEIAQIHFPFLSSAIFASRSLPLLNTLLASLLVDVFCTIELILQIGQVTFCSPQPSLFPAARGHVKRQHWSILCLVFDITPQRVSLWVYPKISGVELRQPGIRLTLRYSDEPKVWSWEDLQAVCRLLWDGFPLENLDQAYINFLLPGDIIADGPYMDRKAGAEWPVKDVFAALFEQVPSSLRELVVGKV